MRRVICLDSHSILSRWGNHFSQLLNIHGVNVDRQTQMHTAEPLVAEPSAFEVEMETEKLKRHKSPGMAEIPAELIKAGSRTISLSSVNLFIRFGKEELPEEWKESMIVSIL